MLTWLALLPLLATALPLQERDLLTSCLNQQGLSIVTPSSSNWKSKTSAFNQRLRPTPAAVVVPANAGQVGKAVACAASAGVAVAARGGGHSYASYGLGGSDGSLVIDLSRLNQIVYDPGSQTVKVGGGQRLGDLAVALDAKGRATPHGTCPWVGIGGHAAFGGFGLASRKWGLTVDQVVSLDVVLADGTTSTVKSDGGDLSWALKGAAPSFAVVTAYTLKTYAKPPNVVMFSYSYTKPSVATASAAFLAFQRFGKDSAPPDLGLTFTIGAGLSITISGAYYGTKSSYTSVFAPLKASMPSGYSQSVTSTSWRGSLQQLANGQALNTVTSGQTQGRDTFFAKSLMTPQATPLSDAAVQSFFAYLKNTKTNTAWFVEVNLYGGPSSLINSEPFTQASSFSQRDRLLGFQLYASSANYAPPYPSNGVSFVAGMYNALVQPMGASFDAGAYVNYVDPTLTAAQVENLYWQGNYARLRVIKAAVDPHNVFRNPQSIPLPT